MDNAIHFILDISDDLLTDILVRLPTVYITRCKMVCKAWNSLISAQSFPGTKLSNSLITHLIYAYADDAHVNLYTICINEFNAFNNRSASVILNTLDMSFLPRPRRQSQARLKILDSCNGLVLFMRDWTSFFVANISNKTWFRLPLPPPSFVEQETSPSTINFYPRIYDHFQVIWPIKSASQINLVIFSSKYGSWTSYELVIPDDKPVNPSLKLRKLYCPTLISHGIVYAIDSRNRSIIEFNVGKKTVDLIDLPEELKVIDLRALVVRKGHLQWCGMGADQHVQIWERGLQNIASTTWTLKHRISNQFMFNGRMDFFGTYVSILVGIQPCFHPDKDAIFIKAMDIIVYYEFDSGEKKTIKLDSTKRILTFLPMSSCLLNIFELKKSWRRS